MTQKEEAEEKKQVRNDGIVGDVSRMFTFTYTEVPEEENRENGKKVLKYKQKTRKWKVPLSTEKGE